MIYYFLFGQSKNIISWTPLPPRGFDLSAAENNVRTLFVGGYLLRDTYREKIHNFAQANEKK